MTVQTAQASQKINRSHILGETPPEGLLARVAKEQGWSFQKTARAWGEYLRFCLLAIENDGRVSPSPAVDAIWHAHLLFTQDYWLRFCPEALCFSLHHVPATGNESAAGFEAQYAETLRKYERIFGVTPPRQFWPAAGSRHGELRPVDVSRYWVIAKPPEKMVAGVIGFGVIVVAVLMLMGAAPAGGGVVVGWKVFDYRGPEFLVFAAISFGVMYIAALLLRQWALRDTVVAGELGKLEPVEIAFLAGGRDRALLATLAALAARGTVRQSPVSARSLDLARGVNARQFQGTALEQEIVQALLSGPLTLWRLRRAVGPALSEIQESLMRRGLAVDTATATWGMWGPALIAAVVPLVSVVKIFVGLSRNKPVEYLVMGVVMMSVVLGLTFLRRPVRTRRGNRALMRVRTSVVKRELKAEAQLQADGDRPENGRRDALVMAVGLYGVGVLAGTDLDDFYRTVSPASDSSGSSSGCGASSCGGGGGGGGGSGCGGCGGH